jgi:CrcB protein
MSVATVVGVGLLGGIGAIARFLLDGSVTGRVGREFPYGTLAVNILGSCLLGVLVGAALSDDADRLAGTGLIGGFTTFSTWALESHRLGEDGRLRSGLGNFAVSLVLGVFAAWAGRHIGSAL